MEDSLDLAASVLVVSWQLLAGHWYGLPTPTTLGQAMLLAVVFPLVMGVAAANTGESEVRGVPLLAPTDADLITPTGRFLRRTSLDEVPQLWNIVRGDMSLVGPRPERPHFVSQFGERYPRYLARHRLPAGLTGWSQIHGLRGDTSIADRARFDNCYIESWSLWLDVKIMLRTVAQVLRFAGR